MNSFYETLSSITLGEIANITNSKIDEKDSDIIITNLASLETSNNESIIYFDATNSVSKALDKSFEYKEKMKSVKAKACFIKEAGIDFLNENIIPVIVDDPKLAFIKLTNFFYKDKALVKKSISKLSSIANNVNFKEKLSVHIGDFVVIEDDVSIGLNCYIGSGVKIKSGVSIGDNCIIKENTVISHSVIGNNVNIGENSTIGGNGFGWHVSREGLVWVPQLGRVILEDGVDIGINTCIDRGVMDDTIIGAGTKIDNIVQIGHNVKTGKNCIFAGMSGVAGSTDIGNGVLVGAQAGISGHLKIADGTQVGAGAGVIQSIEKADKVSGYPAVSVSDFLKQTALLRRMTKKTPKK